MSHPEDLKRRFDGVMARLKAIRSQLDVAVEDGTVVVDTGDLDIKCRRYREQIDQFLQLPDTPEIDDSLGKTLIDLSIAIDDMKRCCADLKGPLDRLISAIYDRLPDDPEYADDAS